MEKPSAGVARETGTPGDRLTTVALKVDVDTAAGARNGLPVLRDLFREMEIKASFYVTMGPDNSGKAIRRLFTRRGFAAKMLRTRAVSLYGLKTLLQGTLLKAPLVGVTCGDLLAGLQEDGHEIGPHGWDHVHWHDHLRRLDLASTRQLFLAGWEAFREVTGVVPHGSAAPGWQATAHSFLVQEELGLLYHSDTRGTGPYFPRLEGRSFLGMEIPTTLPTLDELLGRTRGVEGVRKTYQQLLKAGALNVLTVHAELEGRAHLALFRAILTGWQEAGVRFARLVDVAREIRSSSVDAPLCAVAWRHLPGRPGPVACQVAEVGPAAAGSWP